MKTINDYIAIAEYAKAIGKSVVTVRQKCERGTLPGAVKIGKNWIVPKDTLYKDARTKKATKNKAN